MTRPRFNAGVPGPLTPIRDPSPFVMSGPEPSIGIAVDEVAVPADKVFAVLDLQVMESKLLPAESWGYFMPRALGDRFGIITPNAARLARNLDLLGIDTKTGEIKLLAGKAERT